MVFYNLNYKTFKEASTSEKPDGLMVVATLFEISKDVKPNSDLDILKTMVEHASKENATYTYKGDLTLSHLMPKNFTGFYLYSGSLTTPPCTETVTWVVLKSKVPVSEDIWIEFHDSIIEDQGEFHNYRKAQELNDRVKYDIF